MAHGIDLVPEAIQLARQRTEGSGVSAHFHLGDLALMKMFQDDYFDLVFDGDCLQMIVDTSRSSCLAEVLRVLKPGGLFVAGGDVRDEIVTERIEGPRKGCYFDPKTRHMFVDGEQRYIILSERELCNEIQNAGFRITDVKHHPQRARHEFIKESIAIHATKEHRKGSESG